MLFIAKYYIIKNFYALSRYLYKHNKRFTKELFRTNVCILIFISKKKKKRSSKRIQQKNRFASTFRDGDSRKALLLELWSVLEQMEAPLTREKIIEFN